MYRRGTADVWYSGKKDLWVEYKYDQKPPKRTGRKVAELLTGPQQLWLSGRAKEGRNIAVIVGSPNGGLIYKGSSWIDAAYTVETILARGNSKRDISAWILHELFSAY